MVIVTLRLHAIADDLANMAAWARRHPSVAARVPMRHWRYLYGRPHRPWVADVTDGDRRFLRGHKDYSEANGTGSRGVYVYYHLEPGRVYEVNELLDRTTARRYLARVENGHIVEVGRV